MISPVFQEFKWLKKVWIFPIYFYAMQIIPHKPKRILKTTKSQKRLIEWAIKGSAHVVTYKRELRAHHLTKYVISKRQKSSNQKEQDSLKELSEKSFCLSKYGENCIKSKNGVWLQRQSWLGFLRRVLMTIILCWELQKF